MLNPHFRQLRPSYLFETISQAIQKHKKTNSKQPIWNLGIGDVTLPLVPEVAQALIQASQEMAHASTFQGYGPSTGYSFLKQAILREEYPEFTEEELFISNGTKNDLHLLQQLFTEEATVLIPGLSYPVYEEASVLHARAGKLEKHGYEKILSLPLLEENAFQPIPPSQGVKIIFLCSPNNPTGMALSLPLLEKWVEYAQKHKAIILFDGAYSAFMQSSPRSIYIVPEAKKVAIECRSFSKTAGFTNLRCSYFVVPKQCQLDHEDLLPKVTRLMSCSFGGVPYLIQKAAAAIYTDQGKKETQKRLSLYQKQAQLLRDGLQKNSFTVYGGIDAPYVWCKTPDDMPSWDFFHSLLKTTGIVGVPGSGFGKSGEGYIRFSAFASSSIIESALSSLKSTHYAFRLNYAAVLLLF